VETFRGFMKSLKLADQRTLEKKELFQNGVLLVSAVGDSSDAEDF
jgi:hypothetical protein